MIAPGVSEAILRVENESGFKNKKRHDFQKKGVEGGCVIDH